MYGKSQIWSIAKKDFMLLALNLRKNHLIGMRREMEYTYKMWVHSWSYSAFILKVKKHKDQPFAVEILNGETIQAIKEGLNGRNLKTFENVEAALDYPGAC